MALAAPAAVDGPGRLATYPLVYRLPSDFSTSYGHYQLFFRTRGPFLGFDRSGESRAGRVWLEDSYNGEDGFGGLNAKRCWTWQVGDTERLDRKRIGDKVRVRFDLRRTGPETRTVTLRQAPSRLEDLPYIWYRHPEVKTRVRWIRLQHLTTVAAPAEAQASPLYSFPLEGAPAQPSPAQIVREPERSEPAALL